MSRRYPSHRKPRLLSMQTLESRRQFDARSEVVIDDAYRAEVNESALTDKGIFFVRDDARYGTELWAANTDGADPRLVVDLTPGELGSRLSSITAVDGGVYFVSSTSDNRKQLWWTDGSASNTRMVVDEILTLERNYTESNSTTPLPSNGNHVYFARPSFAGPWSASDHGNVVQPLTSNESFVDVVPGDWRLTSSVESFQETKFGPSVFIVSATIVSGGVPGVSRKFFGITDGTPEGTKVSDFAVLQLADIFEAVALSDDKVMFSERSDGNRGRVLTIDGQGTVELLNESFSSPFVEFEKSGSHWFFSTTSQDNLALFRTDGTPDGTQIVRSAGFVHSSPRILSDGSVLTLAGWNWYDRDFQVTNPETLVTTKLDFIVPSEDGVIRKLYGSIVVGADRFFYVETTLNNTGRLMMADTKSRTVTTILDANPNEAIGAQVLRGNNLFFTHVTPTRSDLVQFNTVSLTSEVLVSVTTDGWQGLLIDTVGEDSLVGFMQGVDNTSIFKLRFAEAKFDIVSLVDEVVSIGKRYSGAIRDSQQGPFWKLDEKTIAFSSRLEINDQPALVQEFAFDTSASGLTRLVSPSLPQPSILKSGTIYDYKDQSVYRAGGKIVYHSGFNTQQHEIWSTVDGKSAQKLALTGAQGSESEVTGNLIPMGVIDDRFYFLSIGPTSRLYRTNEDATAVEFVTDTPWGGHFFNYDNYQFMYRPSLPDDPQRILLRRMGDGTNSGVWEIAGNPPALTKIVEQSDVLDNCEPGQYDYSCSPHLSSGAMSFSGTESRGPLVEVVPVVEPTVRMVSFFGENSSLTLSEQKTVKLYRLDSAWVGVVPGPDETYSVWSRGDDSVGATRVSDLDVSQFKTDNDSVSFLDFAATTDALVFIVGSKVIRVDRDGTHSFVDVPPLANSRDFYRSAPHFSHLTCICNYVNNSLRGDTLLLAGGVLNTDHVYTLSADARSVREVYVAGDKHAVSFEQVKDNASQYILTAAWSKINRDLQNFQTMEVTIDQPESMLSLAGDRVVVQAGEQTLHDGAASALSSFSIQTTTRAAVVNVDVGTVTPSSQFPRGGVSITMAAGSIVRLIGTAQWPVIYQLDNDVLMISIGGLTIHVLNLSVVTIEDQLVARDRNWNFSPWNDDVEIRPSGANETELVEHIRNVVIRVAGPIGGEGESPNAEISKWRINTKTGFDKLTVAPDISAIALLSIVSDLDSGSALKVNLPPVTGPLDVSRQNGRTFASVSVAGLRLQMDNSRRPRHNLVKANDADNNGYINSLDSLRIINTISRQKRRGESNADVMFGDTNGDGRTTALDALFVINQLARQNRMGQIAGEGEVGRKKFVLEPPAKEVERVSSIFD